MKWLIKLIKAIMNFFWSHRLPQSQIFTVNYGRLYNWYAATDVRNIANTGWHVPTEAEVTTLSDYVGGLSVSGLQLKESGIIYWAAPNSGAINQYLFNARGSGQRSNVGDFGQLNLFNRIWTTNSVNTSIARQFIIQANDSIATFNGLSKKYGSSLRLIKDSTALSHGQTGTYTGNDGKVYRTVCIGTQEWLGDNLLETKYRDGSLIPEVTDDTAWAALTTGAMCYYNNDPSNG